MSFGEHLEELRRRLILALVGVGLAMVGTFAFGGRLIAWLARPYLEAQAALGFSPQLYAFGFDAGFATWMKVALIAAMVLAGPWVLYQAWSFIVEGLYEHERRAVHLLWPMSAVMTILGVLFAYHVMLPVVAVFFLKTTTWYPPVEVGPPRGLMPYLVRRPAETPATADPDRREAMQLPVLGRDPDPLVDGSVWLDARDGRIKVYLGGAVRSLSLQPANMLTAMPSLDRFVTSVAIIMLGVVAAFQLPVIMLVLGWTGLFDPRAIAGVRRHAAFVLLVVAAVLTPADVLSMVLLFVPLYALFEIGLVLMRWSYASHDAGSSTSA